MQKESIQISLWLDENTVLRTECPMYCVQLSLTSLKKFDTICVAVHKKFSSRFLFISRDTDPDRVHPDSNFKKNRMLRNLPGSILEKQRDPDPT